MNHQKGDMNHIKNESGYSLEAFYSLFYSQITVQIYTMSIPCLCKTAKNMAGV
jgi:hypothetical protein